MTYSFQSFVQIGRANPCSSDLADDALAWDCAIRLRVVDGLVAVDPEPQTRSFGLYDISIPIIRAEHSRHGRLVCGCKRGVAAGLIVKISPITIPEIRLIPADILSAGNAFTAELDS